MTTEPTIIDPSQMILRDVVRRIKEDNTPWSDSTVVRITDNAVTLFRPYVHCDNFEYTGGVLHYIGAEKYDIPRNQHAGWVLLERPGRPK